MRVYTVLRILTLSVLLLNIKAFSQDENFYIFLCFGQSNMEGQGTIEQQDKTVDPRFQVMETMDCSGLRRSKGKWYTAVPPLCRCNTNLSPVDYFGRRMVEVLPPEIKVGVINVSVAGCKIELFDKDNYQAYAATAPSWMTGIINQYNGNPYQYLVDMAKLAQKDGVIKGILMHQGESNTGDNQWPAKVKGVYNNLLSDLGLQAASVPLLAGEVVGADQGGSCASMNSIIANLPKTIPTSYVISSKGCTDAADNLHFNSAGYRELGKRYADKMLSLLGYTPTGFNETGFEAIEGFKLHQNYPNPFNPVTSITFSVPQESFVSLDIFDALGRRVASLVAEELQPGTYARVWNAEGMTSGVYYYTLKTVSFAESKKLVLLR